jgi:hypothetical protein
MFGVFAVGIGNKVPGAVTLKTPVTFKGMQETEIVAHFMDQCPALVVNIEPVIPASYRLIKHHNAVIHISGVFLG